MKKFLMFCFILLSVCAIGCQEGASNEEKKEKIDKTVEDAKSLIDKIGNKAKEILEDEELEKIKEILEKTNDGSQPDSLLNVKIEELKDNPEVKAIIDKHKGDVEDILKQIEQMIKDLDGNAESQN